jgi:HD-GYP domain-containing protein (c-di-GMP phosphodiesterase class II)
VPVANLEVDARVDFDLFVRTQRGHSVYLRAGSNVHAGIVKGLAESGVRTLYMTLAGAPKYTAYVVEQARATLRDGQATADETARAMRLAVSAVAQELAEGPTPETIRSAQEIVEMIVAEVSFSEQSIAALVRITYVSYRLHTHMVNCAIYALAVCGPLGITNLEVLSAMGMAGLLFDIGLTRHGQSERLAATTPGGEEDRSLLRHPEDGRNMLRAIPGMPRLATDAALCHHERWDGGGYPAKLRGVRIPLAGRVAAVVDTFDTMMTDPAAGPRKGSFAILMQMRDGDSGHFDPDVLRSLIAGLAAASRR